MRQKTQSHWSFCSAVLLVGFFILFHTAYALEEYVTTSEAKTSAKGVTEFHLTVPFNLGGKINLQAADSGVCRVKLECRAKANSKEKARKFTEMVDLDLEREEESVTLSLTTPKGAPWEGTNYGIKVTLDILVPPDITVETKTSGFDLNVDGPLKGVDVENMYGDVRLKDVSGETSVNAGYGEVNAEDIRGSLDIQTSYNSISLVDVKTAGGQASLKTTYGNINLEKFTGQLEASTVYSSIYGSGLTLDGGTNEIKTVYSKIDLQFDEIRGGELYIKNTYGNINLVTPKNLSAKVTLSVGRGGKISTKGILIKPQVLEETRLEGTCGEGESDVEVEISGIGQISLEGR
ncbi:MAG: DUF4097 family beta strand repeat-containing protein [Candidatus Zixiibacteriota bacterium]